jgi:hypothetical protein
LTQAYRAVLGRDPDPSAQGFVNALNAGMLSRQQVAAILTGSGEYRDRLINQVYGALLDRSAGPGDLAVWEPVLAQPPAGPGQPSPDEQFETAVIGSGEYFQKHQASNVGFVTSLYTTLLGRQPDSGGFDGTLQQLLGSYTSQRQVVAAAFTTSGESRTRLVTGYFSQFLGRGASAGEIAGYVGQLAAGVSDEQVIVAFVSSGEYFDHNGGSNMAYVTALYRDLLGRSPDSSSQQFLTGLNNGSLSRGQLAAVLLGSLEYRERLVGQIYQSYLGRQGGKAELDFWAGQIQQGSDEQVKAAILASGEYLERPHAFP